MKPGHIHKNIQSVSKYNHINFNHKRQLKKVQIHFKAFQVQQIMWNDNVELYKICYTSLKVKQYSLFHFYTAKICLSPYQTLQSSQCFDKHSADLRFEEMYKHSCLWTLVIIQTLSILI